MGALDRHDGSIPYCPSDAITYEVDDRTYLNDRYSGFLDGRGTFDVSKLTADQLRMLRAQETVKTTRASDTTEEVARLMRTRVIGTTEKN